ncbi:MAG: hypothetical protein Kow0065_04460 [Methylomicrobium sp.]
MRHILCFGNPLHGDDGFGPAVYRKLAAQKLPSDVRLFDAGTPGLAALSLFQDCCEAIIVDAVASGGVPGEVSWLAPETTVPEPALIGHGIGVGYLLQAVAALPECPPRIRIVAAEIARSTPFSPGLSEPVRQAVDAAFLLLKNHVEQTPYR